MKENKIKAKKKKFYALQVLGISPSWPSIKHGLSGITAHLETATFNTFSRRCQTQATWEGSLPTIYLLLWRIDYGIGIAGLKFPNYTKSI